MAVKATPAVILKLQRASESLGVMVNFTWLATGYSNIWSNIILGVSVREFLDTANIINQYMSKADCLHNVGRPNPISWGPALSKRLTFCPSKMSSVLSALAVSIACLLASSSTSALRLELCHQLSLGLRPANLLCRCELASLPNLVSQFLILSQSAHIQIDR